MICLNLTCVKRSLAGRISLFSGKRGLGNEPMAKPVKRRRPKQSGKRRAGALPASSDNPVEQGAALLRPGERESVEDPLEDFPDDEQDAWLLEREAEDVQRDDR